jgi:hypothetical protein
MLGREDPVETAKSAGRGAKVAYYVITATTVVANVLCETDLSRAVRDGDLAYSVSFFFIASASVLLYAAVCRSAPGYLGDDVELRVKGPSGYSEVGEEEPVELHHCDACKLDQVGDV